MVVAGVCCAVAAALVWGEVEHWRSSTRRLGSAATRPAASRTVVVLGYRNRGDRINAVNRWRVRAGLRSLTGARSRLVFCGGAPGGGRPEAELMADHARQVCGYRGPLAVEADSRTTWENVRAVIPLIEDAEQIAVVSHALHAEKARAYLWRQRPDLAERLVRGEEYRLGEGMLLKPLLAVLGRWKLAHLRPG